MADPLNLFAAAQATLERIKSLTAQVGLNYVELPEAPFGVGIAVALDGTQYVVLSVMGGGSEGLLNITSGVLRDIQQDRLTALTLCNARVRENPAFPVYLHDAQIGWDILVATVFPAQMLIGAPPFFANAIRAMVIVADEVRPKFLEAELGGQPFNWNAENLYRLLLLTTL